MLCVFEFSLRLTLFLKKKYFVLKKKDFIYLFLERGEEKKKERERNINVWLPLARPHWGPSLQPRHVPWLGVQPVTLWLAGQCSIHWATPARARLTFVINPVVRCGKVAKPNHFQILWQLLWPVWVNWRAVNHQINSGLLYSRGQWVRYATCSGRFVRSPHQKPSCLPPGLWNYSLLLIVVKKCMAFGLFLMSG